MRRLLIWLVVFILMVCMISVFSLIGCKTTAAVETTSAVETTAADDATLDLTGKKVALLVLGTQTPYLPPYMETVKKGFADVGIELTVFDAAFDAALQATQMDDAIALNPDLILLFPLDSQAVSPGIKKAFDSGIPILVDNNKVIQDDQQYTIAYVGPDTYDQGLKCGELMDKVLEGKGKVAIIEGYPGQEAQINRSQGFEDKIKEINSGIEVVAKQTGEWVKAKATSLMEDYLVRFPDLSGLYAADDTMAVGALVAMEEAGIEKGAIKVIGIGGSKEGLAAIKDGSMYGTVLQSPVLEANLAVEFSIKILEMGLKAGDQLDPYLNFQPAPVITAENVEEYLPGEW